MELSYPRPRSPSGKVYQFSPNPDAVPRLFLIGSAPSERQIREEDRARIRRVQRPGHLRAGSVTLRTGDRVTRGDRLGEIGFSGDTGFHVHVHYHLASGADLFGTRALPAQFERFSRVVGSRTVFTERGPIATGDILVSNAGR